jgi:hypothetical protein
VAFIKPFRILHLQQKYLFLIAFVFIFCPSIRAQEKTVSTSQCVTLTATHSGKNSFLWGEHITVTAALGNSSKTKFKWTISSGKIISGEDTNSITIDTDTTNGDLKIDLEAENNGTVCSHSISLQQIACILPREMDRYGNLPLDAEYARLDNVAAVFIREPAESQIFIIVQNSGKNDAAESLARIVRAKKYLTGRRKIDSAKISLYVSADKNSDYDETVIYIMPKDSPFPFGNYKTVIEDEFLELSKRLPAQNTKRNKKPKASLF